MAEVSRRQTRDSSVQYSKFSGAPASPAVLVLGIQRRVQSMWRRWQERAGFDRLYPFHSLRHTSVTNVYRTTRDLFLAQRFARHASPLTTTLYTHPGDDEIAAQVRNLRC